MNHEELKDEIKQISEIASSVPEQFKDKCFEMLLSSLLRGDRVGRTSTDRAPNKESTSDDESNSPGPKPDVSGIAKLSTPLTTQIRLLMRRTGVTVEEIDRVVLCENEQVHFIKEPHNVPIAHGQIEWALLIALKNGILKDSMITDPEDVRSVCQEKGYYDTKNFSSNFKRGGNPKLFKNLLAAQGDAQPLTVEGQDALGKLIKRLAAEVA